MKLNLRRIHECHALADAALAEALLHLGRDVDEGPAGGHVEPEFFAEGFHDICVISVAALLLRPNHTDFLQGYPILYALYLLIFRAYLSNNPFSIVLRRALVCHLHRHIKQFFPSQLHARNSDSGNSLVLRKP